MRPSRIVLALLVCLAGVSASVPAAAQTVVRHLEIESGLADRQIESLVVRYRAARAREVAARGRAEELAGELDRTLEAGGTPVADLETLSAELADTGARAEAAATEARLLRHDLLDLLRRREAIAAELRRLRGAPADLPDPLTGTWELTLDLGAGRESRRGLLDLSLDGTTVRGTLGLDDGSFGSVTGTFTGGRLRLERVSAEGGLDVALDGRLAADGSLRGTWRPLVLGRGEPPGGTWEATRPEEEAAETETGEGSGGAR